MHPSRANLAGQHRLRSLVAQACSWCLARAFCPVLQAPPACAVKIPITLRPEVLRNRQALPCLFDTQAGGTVLQPHDICVARKPPAYTSSTASASPAFFPRSLASMKASRSPSITAGDVARLLAGAVVLDHLVGLEDVAADLVAPGDVALLAVLTLHLGFLLVLLDLVELGLEHRHGLAAVLALAALAPGSSR